MTGKGEALSSKGRQPCGGQEVHRGPRSPGSLEVQGHWAEQTDLQTTARPYFQDTSGHQAPRFPPPSQGLTPENQLILWFWWHTPVREGAALPRADCQEQGFVQHKKDKGKKQTAEHHRAAGTCQSSLQTTVSVLVLHTGEPCSPKVTLRSSRTASVSPPFHQQINKSSLSGKELNQGL